MSIKRTWPISNRISFLISTDIREVRQKTKQLIIPFRPTVEDKAGFEVVADRSEQLAQYYSIRVFFRHVFRFP